MNGLGRLGGIRMGSKFWIANFEIKCKQECILVGCVPSAAVAVSRGVYLVLGGGCTWSRGGVPGLGGVPGPRGGLYLVPGGGVPGPRGGVPGQVLPPCGQTHACKYITFATLLRTVTRFSDHSQIYQKLKQK